MSDRHIRLSARVRRAGARRLHALVVLAVGVVAGIAVLAPAAPSAAAETTLCTGFTACQAAGRGNYGYESVYTQSFWSQDPNHNCTNYVAFRFSQKGIGRPSWARGGAAAWGRNSGVPLDQNPTPGSIAWWRSKGSAGHVAIVEQVNSDGSIVTSDDVWRGDFHWRSYTRGSLWPSGFIHLNDAALAPPTLPAEPTSPRVTSTTSGSAVLAWNDVSNNETDFVTQYRVGSGAWTAGPTAGAGATSITIGGLRPSTTYTFQVGARNAAGTHWSAWATGRTPAAPPVTLPAEPTSPRVTSTTGSSAVLAWNDVSNNETDFVTQYRVGSGAWTAGPTAGAGATSITIGGLQPSTTYTFQVGARNAAGTHWSAWATGTTSAQTQSFDYQVTNYDADGTRGVYLRNSPDINDVNRDSAHYVLYGTTVTLLCGGWGSPVGPHNNHAWDYVRVSDGRTGWLSEHWLNTPVRADQHVPGEPSC